MSEEEVWFGTPSQIVNLGNFIILGLFFWLVIPLFFILWHWLVIKNTKYELSTQQLRTKTGVFNKKTDVLELYRVKDYHLEQPFYYRIFSLGDVVIKTSDISDPFIKLRAISNSADILAKLRTCVENCRADKGVREFDVR